MCILKTETGGTRYSRMCAYAACNANRMRAMLNAPIIAPILRDRVLSTALLGACAAQVTAFFVTGHGWQCPIRAALGIPCPGCGLTHATLLLFQGKWQDSLSEHAFASIFIFGLVLVAVASLMPRKNRDQLAKLVATVESRTNVTTLVLISLMGYWGIRLLLSVRV